jgi:hypothetical protein
MNTEITELTYNYQGYQVISNDKYPSFLAVSKWILETDKRSSHWRRLNHGPLRDKIIKAYKSGEDYIVE